MSILDFLRPSATREAVGALEELIAEPWAMEPGRLEQVLASLATRVRGASRLELDAARRAAASADVAAPYVVHDGVAVIPVRGMILKTVPSWFAWFDISATSTQATEAALAAALADRGVTSIVLDVESPGGTIAGVQELADALYAARGRKPISAHVSDLCASAAYWIACQADSVSANETALIGSIGVYRVMQDWSRMFETAGIRTHVITSHPLKGVGVFGAPITDAQRADMQREIDGFAAMFTAAVARGRGLDAEAVRGLATGQCWLAPEAVTLKLIDGVATFTTALADVCPPADDNEEEDGPPGPPAMGAAETAPGGSMNKPVTPAASAQASTTTAPAVAQDAELARLRAENELLRDTARRQAKQRKGEVAARHRAAGRIVPAQQDLVDRLSASFGDDVEGFDKALAALPVQVRLAPQGAVPGEQRVDAIASTEELAAERHVARVFDTTAQQLATSSDVASVDLFRRVAVMRDGSTRPLQQLYS